MRLENIQRGSLLAASIWINFAFAGGPNPPRSTLVNCDLSQVKNVQFDQCTVERCDTDVLGRSRWADYEVKGISHGIEGKVTLCTGEPEPKDNTSNLAAEQIQIKNLILPALRSMKVCPPENQDADGKYHPVTAG